MSKICLIALKKWNLTNIKTNNPYKFKTINKSQLNNLKQINSKLTDIISFKLSNQTYDSIKPAYVYINYFAKCANKTIFVLIKIKNQILTCFHICTQNCHIQKGNFDKMNISM